MIKKKSCILAVKVWIKIILIIVSIIVSIILLIINNNNKKEQTKEILKHYNELVITNKISNLYENIDGKFIKTSLIASNQEIKLINKKITYKDKYLKLKSLDGIYYIYYKDIEKQKNKVETNNRYKNYIPYNENIITTNPTNFYDKLGKQIYKLNRSFEFPIIIKEENKYGIEYNNQIFYIKKEDVINIKENKNTNLENTEGIAVLNYHFFYDETKQSEIDSCNQIICTKLGEFNKQLKYIKENKIFTPTMEELEMYIDEKIQLPKSVVITIDDGWRSTEGIKLLEEYKLNATIFLIAKTYDIENFESEYIEVHSHGYDIHNGGLCAGGQGAEIKCMEKNKLINDLITSRKKLKNTTIFCYPFYEYNDYSIEMLKLTGFTMAFGGYNEQNTLKVKPKINKYKLPRYVIYNNTTIENLKQYIN